MVVRKQPAGRSGAVCSCTDAPAPVSPQLGWGIVRARLGGVLLPSRIVAHRRVESSSVMWQTGDASRGCMWCLLQRLHSLCRTSTVHDALPLHTPTTFAPRFHQSCRHSLPATLPTLLAGLVFLPLPLLLPHAAATMSSTCPSSTWPDAAAPFDTQRQRQQCWPHALWTALVWLLVWLQLAGCSVCCAET